MNAPPFARLLAWLLAAVVCGCSGQQDIDHAAVVRERLASADAEERRAAIDELGQLGALSDENLALAEAALDDDDPQVRKSAARLLIAQTAERPELGERLVVWAEATADPACRQLLADAAVGKLPQSGE